MRAKRQCTHPGCTVLTDGKEARCARHPRPKWVGNATSQGKRMTGRPLQRARAKLFREHPLCAECERNGRVALATIRDHIVPLAEGGEDVEGNTQGLCQACSDAKSAAEAARGVRRAFGGK